MARIVDFHTSFLTLKEKAQSSRGKLTFTKTQANGSVSMNTVTSILVAKEKNADFDTVSLLKKDSLQVFKKK